MSNFSLQPLMLSVASSAVRSSGDDLKGARSSLTGASGALAGTSAEGAYHGLVSAAGAASAGFTDASYALAYALQKASDAYMTADESAAASLAGGHG